MCGTAMWYPEHNEVYFAALRELSDRDLGEQLSWHSLSYHSTLLVPSFDKADLEQEVERRTVPIVLSVS